MFSCASDLVSSFLVPRFFILLHFLTSTMTIESCFPQNPTQTTIENAASTGTHIFFPWSNHPVQLGAGFKSKKARDGDPFEVPCAFANWSRDSIPVTYINDDGLRGSELSTSSSNSAFSSEHLSVSLGVSAGCKFLGGSVAGAYDTAIENNTDVKRAPKYPSVFYFYYSYFYIPTH